MGCYDTVSVPCPRCGEKYDAQSKGGDCVLAHYELADCPPDVLCDVNRHAPFECGCGCFFAVRLTDGKPQPFDAVGDLPLREGPPKPDWKAIEEAFADTPQSEGTK